MAQSPAKPASKGVTPIQRTRMHYVSQRVKELKAEVKALRDEGRQVRDALRGLSARQTPEAKALKLRRSYLLERPEEIRLELARLMAERNAVKG